jgi:hypothetical protein
MHSKYYENKLFTGIGFLGENRNLVVALAYDSKSLIVVERLD